MNDDEAFEQSISRSMRHLKSLGIDNITREKFRSAIVKALHPANVNPFERAVRSSEPAEEPSGYMGYRVVLEPCGHEVWYAVPPAPTAYCSQCLHDWLAEHGH